MPIGVGRVSQVNARSTADPEQPHCSTRWKRAPNNLRPKGLEPSLFALRRHMRTMVVLHGSHQSIQIEKALTY
jgi:hypothetical protein